MGNGTFSTCALNKLVLAADTPSFGGATSPSFLCSEGLSTTVSSPTGLRDGHVTQAGTPFGPNDLSRCEYKTQAGSMRTLLSFACGHKDWKGFSPLWLVSQWSLSPPTGGIPPETKAIESGPRGAGKETACWLQYFNLWMQLCLKPNPL